MEVEVTDSLWDRAEAHLADTFNQIMEFLDEMSIEASTGDVPLQTMGFLRQVKRPFPFRGQMTEFTITFTIEPDRITVMDIQPMPDGHA